MSTNNKPADTAAMSDGDILKEKSARRSSAGSPQAMEATLANISDEVTAEAIERIAYEAHEKQAGRR